MFHKKHAYAKELEVFDQSLILQPSNPNLIAHKARATFKLERIIEAKSLNDQALNIDPLNFQAMFNKALFAIHEEDYQDALTTLEECLKIDRVSDDINF